MLPPPPPPPRSPPMSSSPESAFHLRIHKGALTCMICRQTLYADVMRPFAYMCAGGHIFCHDCTSRHEKECISCSLWLHKITSQMKVKCNLCDSGYMPYCSFVLHRCDPLPHGEAADRQLNSIFELGDCTLDSDLLVCSQCNLPLQLPIFMHVPSGSPVCSACYSGGDIINGIHHRELEYIVQHISAKCMACEEYLPFSTLARHQLDHCPFNHKLQKIAPSSSAGKNLCGNTCMPSTMLPPPPPRRPTVPPPFPPPPRSPQMSSSPEEEESAFHLRIRKNALSCMICYQIFHAGGVLRPFAYMCAGDHIFCRGCTSRHGKECITRCNFLHKITNEMKVKCSLCNFGYMPYFRFVGHQCETPLHREVVDRELNSVFELGDCILDANLLVCSQCNLPLEPPIFRHVSCQGPVCSSCCRGRRITNYIHHRELEYIIQHISAKCMACEQYITFSALARHQLDHCPFKHKLQRIAPSSCAQNNLCDEEEFESPTTRNSCIHGKNNQKASFE